MSPRKEFAAQLLGATVIIALLLATAMAGRTLWWAERDLRRPLTPLARPGPDHVEVPCASVQVPGRMVVLVLGQSNAANHVESRGDGGPAAFTFHRGRCLRAVDPLPGASGDGGSLWTRLAPMLVEAGAARSVLLVPVAVNATSVEHWTRHAFMVEQLDATLEELRRARLDVTHVVWYQGEADSFRRTGADAYRRDLLSIFRRLRDSGISAPIWLARSTLCQRRSNPAVRQVQAALPDEVPGLRAGPDMDALFGPEHRYDGCHFGTASALLAARAWRDALLAPAHEVGASSGSAPPADRPSR